VRKPENAIQVEGIWWIDNARQPHEVHLGEEVFEQLTLTVGVVTREDDEAVQIAQTLVQDGAQIHTFTILKRNIVDRDVLDFNAVCPKKYRARWRWGNR